MYLRGGLTCVPGSAISELSAEVTTSAELLETAVSPLAVVAVAVPAAVVEAVVLVLVLLVVVEVVEDWSC